MRGRMGDGRGRGMTLTSRRQVLGLQRAGLGYWGTGGFTSESCVSWHKGRSKTGKEQKEKTLKGHSGHLLLNFYKVEGLTRDILQTAAE